MESLWELAQMVRNGCDNEDYKRFAAMIRGRCYRYFLFKGIPPFQAEDLTVDFVTKIVIGLHKYEAREGASFEAWLNTVMQIGRAHV